ncbi:MAG: DUF2760 domain-containing protein [Desulfobacteraceae bacterium]|nr:DUF2760 domain-containing protein [Desulfobacteraceae bacterium]
MEVSKIYSKISFRVITVFGVLFIACITTGFFFGIDWFLANFSRGSGEDVVAKNLSWLVQQFELAFDNLYELILPVTASVVLIFGFFLWLILKSSMSSVFKQFESNEDSGQKSATKKKDFIDQKIEQDRKRRLFLHSFSFLQREGRLLDFFEEDLSLYDDEQIGAAVRSIQEDCKKAVKKYIDPKPVIENEEGDMVSVEEGFDLDSIKLIGNVSGKPPFEGVLKHRGWKAGKKEIPKLSDIQDATIIIPAEVEIQ